MQYYSHENMTVLLTQLRVHGYEIPRYLSDPQDRQSWVPYDQLPLSRRKYIWVSFKHYVSNRLEDKKPYR
jgi:hypothetical protein